MVETVVLKYNLDLLFFAVVCLMIAFGSSYFLRKKASSYFPFKSWGIIFSFILLGAFLSSWAGENQRKNMTEILQGLAPTYAKAFEELGHAQVQTTTAPDDSLYLSLIEMQKKWLKANLLVQDIYTFRKSTDGKVVLLVDSETDYDRNGEYQGDREQRTSIGEEYPQISNELLIAFEGHASFDNTPYTDRWGTWVSAFEPLRGADGRVEGVLGVDYPAKKWVKSILLQRLVVFSYVLGLILLFLSGLIGKLLVRHEADMLRKTSEENQRLAFAVDSASDGVLMTDPNQQDNPVIYANPMFYKITGYTPSEVMGKNCRFLQGPETDLKSIHQIREAIRKREPIKVSILNYRKDGTTFWNGLRISPAFSKSGELKYFLGFQADITDRMNQEQELIAERDYTRSIIKGTPAIICGISPEGITYSINPEGERITGYKASEIVGKNWWNTFYPGSDRAQVEKLFKAFENGDVRDYEMTLTSKNGEKKIVSWNSLNRLDENGKLIEVVGFGNDVTAKRKAEEELHQNEEAFRFTLLSAPVMVWMADASMKFVFVNRFWLDFTGRKAKDELDDGWMDSIYPEDRKSVIRVFENSYKDRADFKIELRMKHRLGDFRWVVASGTARFNDQGGFAGYIGSCVDIHERKKLEVQLQQSQKMETVGTLAGGIAHDLNNQLTPLTGYLDLLLQETPPGDSRRELLVEAEQAARRSAEVVQRLMNISRASNQKKSWIKLHGLLAESKRLFSKILPSTIQTEVICDNSVWPILANDTEIQTVLMNMTVNARDAMPQGGKLTIEAKNIELKEGQQRVGFKSGEYVLISVSDSGSGISQDDLHKIFEPFFTTKPKGQGTGLGLSMVFRVINDHGGWVEPVSEKGKGTTMKIYLPADSKAQLQSAPGANSEPAIPRGSETILFADDEEALRNMGRVFLEKLGYCVLLAQDGQEAVDVYERNKESIHAVILDMTMPKLTGRQTLKKILEINPAAKVLLASGFTSEGTAKELICDGARDFLPKPYTILQVSKILRNIIDSKA